MSPKLLLRAVGWILCRYLSCSKVSVSMLEDWGGLGRVGGDPRSLCRQQGEEISWAREEER